MAANFDFTDFYILYKGHPRYNDKEVFEDNILNVILQKYQLLLYTQKGEMYGDPDFGADILKYLFKTRVSAQTVEKEIQRQISIYIPELVGINYSIDITFDEHPTDFTDMMFISFRINEIEVNNFFA